MKYGNFVDAVLEAQQFGVMGRNLHMNLATVQGNGKKTGNLLCYIKYIDRVPYFHETR